jgi:hypothetical protein
LSFGRDFIENRATHRTGVTADPRRPATITRSNPGHQSCTHLTRTSLRATAALRVSGVQSRALQAGPRHPFQTGGNGVAGACGFRGGRCAWRDRGRWSLVVAMAVADMFIGSSGRACLGSIIPLAGFSSIAWLRRYATGRAAPRARGADTSPRGRLLFVPGDDRGRCQGTRRSRRCPRRLVPSTCPERRAERETDPATGLKAVPRLACGRHLPGDPVRGVSGTLSFCGHLDGSIGRRGTGPTSRRSVGAIGMTGWLASGLRLG